MSTRLVLGLAIAACLVAQGCQAPTPVAPRPSVKAVGEKGASTRVRTIPLVEPPRLVAQVGAPIVLEGHVRLISDSGGGLIGSVRIPLIGHNGAGVVSNNSGSLISNNGGSLVSRLTYATQAAASPDAAASGAASPVAAPAAGPAESLLADAQIEVLDATGRVLVGPDKKPLSAITDHQGGYSFKAVLPDENLIFRIRLYTGGQLFAFVTRDARGRRTLDIDTASSLGAAYVLEKYVQKQQQVLDRLPGQEAEALRAAVDGARARLDATTAPRYTPDEQVALGERLRVEAPALDTRLKAIAAILLAGQQDLGNGRQASEVPLGSPIGVAGDAQGNLYIAEGSAGRIRKVAPDGTISTWAGQALAPTLVDGASALEAPLGILSSLAAAPDGSLYLGLFFANRLVRLTPDGKVKFVAGTGASEQGALGGPALAAALLGPHGLAVGPDGRPYLGEDTHRAAVAGRVLYVDAQGQLQGTPTPVFADPLGVSGLAVASDGAVWAVGSNEKRGELARLAPGGAWTMVDTRADTAFSTLAPLSDGAVCVSETHTGRLVRYDAQGGRTVLAGTGTPGYSGDGGPATAAQLGRCEGMWRRADGTLFVADTGNTLVRAIAPDGTIRTVAGTRGLTQTGDALTVAINQPGGMAIDPQGRLVIAETASHVIKRLDGQTLVTIAGGLQGFGGDGGPATAASFDGPGGLSYHDGALFIADTVNMRIRRIASDGTVTTVAGGGRRGSATAERELDPADAPMKSLIGLATGPDGAVYWVDGEASRLFRLKDGRVTLIAGALEGTPGDAGDGGPASAALLNRPTSLTVDKAGNVYIADTGNLRVRRIDAQGVITTVAGMPLQKTIAALLTGAAAPDGTPGTQAAILGPVGLCLDDAGNLYIAEAGLSGVGSLAGANSAVPLPLELLPRTYARIRKLSPDGRLTTLTGPGTRLLNDPASDNSLKLPTGLVIDRQGRLIIADAGLNQIKLLPTGSF